MARSTRAQMLARRQQVWDMRTREGKTQTKIADELGVNQATVSRDLKYLCTTAAAELEDLVKETKITQVAQLEEIAADLMEEWRKSKEARKSVRRVQRRSFVIDPITGQLTRDAAGKPIEVDEGVDVVTNVTEQVGNVHYIDRVFKALSDVRRILGAEAPLLYAHDVTSGGVPIQVREVVAIIPPSAVEGNSG